MTKVIAVHSFKGGTGKTTLTANLAATLALHHRVGVMDLDLSGPGLHVLFGLKKGEVKATMTDIFLGDATPSDVIIDLTPRFPKMKGGLFFCPASNKVEDMLRLFHYSKILYRRWVNSATSITLSSILIRESRTIRFWQWDAAMS